ncbi:MAG: enoyl-CoA hydratase [Solirubrobacteraceae bacterium]|jgi:enoyl-CoA hydratase/carnithine racemase|nr:enoyl-CoA hydratase [Solirubrobacteraceae bacterium]
MPGELRIDQPANGVLRLAISNPAKRNALDFAILDQITHALSSLDGVRCVILTGRDGMFSSGYDIGEIPEELFAQEAEKLVAHPFTEALAAFDSVEVPTVAALGGPTIGGGLELSLGCDVRIAHDGIRLGMPPAKLGLVYSHTGLRRFLNAIGEPRTRELFLLGRYIDAPTALMWGLVNWVVPPEELEQASIELASQLAANAPLSMAGNKRVLRELLCSEAALDPDIERELIALRKASFHTDDMKEGVMAFAEKRPPRWTGR